VDWLCHGAARGCATIREQSLFRLGVRAVSYIQHRMDRIRLVYPRNRHGGDAAWVYAHESVGGLELVDCQIWQKPLMFCERCAGVLGL